MCRLFLFYGNTAGNVENYLPFGKYIPMHKYIHTHINYVAIYLCVQLHTYTYVSENEIRLFASMHIDLNVFFVLPSTNRVRLTHGVRTTPSNRQSRENETQCRRIRYY